MNELYTVIYRAHPLGTFTDTFRVESNQDIQVVIDGACQNATLLERDRVINILRNIEPGSGVMGDDIDLAITLIQEDN